MWTTTFLLKGKLDCIYWQFLGEEYDPDDQHFTEALVESCQNHQPRFPNIQHLVLEGYLFNDHRVSLLKDLNPDVLHTLSLRSCLFWEDLLPLLNSEDRRFHLRTLEVQTYPGSLPGECHELANFIENCEPLENIFIALEWALDLERLWESLLRHRKTLKSFVFYSRDPQTAPMPYYKDIEPERLALKHLDLELLGVSYESKYLIPALSPLTTMGNLKVLLIQGFFIPPESFQKLQYLGRLSNEEPSDRRQIDGFDKFLQWAFGPEGIRSLRLIVHYNPFECDGDEMLLCPKVGPDAEPPFPGRNYRLVTKRDHVQYGLLRKHANALKACPSRGLEDISFS
ncbi:hypothetical protein TESG_06830 [Trichophyton tonsurans CBS 112818]|uniref:F-box domain-containing protein n=1 Tax=Trichophyton tonsurans (strain CBS 112818) TaxID=647933 RepID=F2S7L4_TRIT1|nr:hypothetical protein TESG_06830 [Trichophyton tonsurans CBS 112818]